MTRNPFTPNSGQVPLQMAGRDEIVIRMQQAFDDGVGSPDLCTLFKGVRGTGKTALLMYLAREAEQRGWISVSTTAIPGMLEDLYEQTLRKAAHVVDTKQHVKLRSISVGQIFGLEWDRGEQPKLNWRSRMTALLEELSKIGIGLVITLDEVDPDLDDVVQLAAVYQHFVGEERKVSLLMAGLPHRISSLLRGKSTSFLRRANQVTLSRISDDDVKTTFTRTIELGGKAVDKAVLSEAAEAIEGFPFMMQLVGYRSWSAAGERDFITREDVELGVTLARKDMCTRVLAATLDELSLRDLEVLACFLTTDQPVTNKYLSEATGMTVGNVSNYRKRLLEQGVIEERARGTLRLALPCLREYLPDYLVSNGIEISPACTS